MKRRGAVAAGHPLVAEAAAAMLGEGGNAYDAAVAGAAAACVAEPLAASPGGGGLLLAADARGRAVLFDFFLHTPRRCREARQVAVTPVALAGDDGSRTAWAGAGTVATPGLVRGLLYLQRELGRLPLPLVLAPAIGLAKNGVTVTPTVARRLAHGAPLLATPEARALFAAEGAADRVAKEGERIVNRPLADLLDALALEGDRLFHEGEPARAMLAVAGEGAGHLGAEDLRRYAVLRSAPLERDFSELRLALAPPPALAGAEIAYAWALLDRPDLPRGTRDTPEAATILASVLDAATRAVAAAAKGEAGETADRLLRAIAAAPPTARLLGGSTHLSVADGRGTVAALSLSNGDGSGIVPPGLGFMLNNGLGEAMRDDALPQWPTGLRLASALAPSLAFLNDGTAVALGGSGGARLPGAIVQVLLHLARHGMGPADAVAAPRLHAGAEVLEIEDDWPEPVRRALARRFPEQRVRPAGDPYFGVVHLAAHGPRDGDARAAGDVRGGGAAL